VRRSGANLAGRCRRVVGGQAVRVLDHGDAEVADVEPLAQRRTPPWPPRRGPPRWPGLISGSLGVDVAVTDASGSSTASR
jgi:hypothetical protein